MHELGIDPGRFNYVKRKGRIHIIDPSSDQSFWYFRRKETRIDPETKQWVKLESYEVKVDNDPLLQLENWQEVLGRFGEWLRSLGP